MKVLKFGGSSVSTPERIKSVIEIIVPVLKQEQIVLVFSAFGGITDTLIQLSEQALSGNEGYKANLKQLEDRHLEAVRRLINIQRQSSILANVKTMVNELEDVIHGIFLVRER